MIIVMHSESRIQKDNNVQVARKGTKIKRDIHAYGVAFIQNYDPHDKRVEASTKKMRDIYYIHVDYVRFNHIHVNYV